MTSLSSVPSNGPFCEQTGDGACSRNRRKHPLFISMTLAVGSKSKRRATPVAVFPGVEIVGRVFNATSDWRMLIMYIFLFNRHAPLSKFSPLPMTPCGPVLRWRMSKLEVNMSCIRTLKACSGKATGWRTCCRSVKWSSIIRLLLQAPHCVREPEEEENTLIIGDQTRCILVQHLKPLC